MTIKAIVFDAYGTLYDVQSVADVTEQAFPGYGEIVTQVWRIKQLEYSWLRTLMRRYQDFSVVTRDSLAYTLRVLGLTYDDAVFAGIMDKYLHLDLYPDALAALAELKGRKLAILSNGSPDMLNALVKNSGLDGVLDATISIDANKVFKPAPDSYALIESTLGIGPDAEFVHLGADRLEHRERRDRFIVDTGKRHRLRRHAFDPGHMQPERLGAAGVPGIGGDEQHV